MTFEVERLRKEGIPGLAISGDVDIHTCKTLQRFLDELIEGGTQTVGLDLQNVRYLDSGGVAVLLSALKKLRSESRQLVVWNRSYQVSRVFRVLGLSFLLESETFVPPWACQAAMA